MVVSFAYFFSLSFCCYNLCVKVESKPLRWHQKRNSHSQEGLRRCGNDDFASTTSLSTEYQYLPDTIAPRLSTQNLSWKITRYPAEIDNHTRVESVDLAVNEAFSLWSSVANLRFYHIDNGTADIEIEFQLPEAHNLQYARYISTGIIAHYVPGSVNPGQIHFNAQYKWTTTRSDSRNKSVNLVNAFAHEVGHLLGFDHTIWPNSIMSRYYSNHVFTAPTVLSSDDISVAVNRYGVKILSYPTLAAPIATPNTTTAVSTTVIPHRSSTFVTSTKPSATTSATTTNSHCDKRHMKTFFQDKRSSLFFQTCAILYELDNCRGNYTMLAVFEGDFDSSRTSSMQIAPNCFAFVCGALGGMRICSFVFPNTIPRLDRHFDFHIDNFSCSCHFCPTALFPITAPDKIICAVAYPVDFCISPAQLFSPGQVWSRSLSGFSDQDLFLSAQVNPNCTVNFCHTETITNHTCLALSGGANGNSNDYLDLFFMGDVTTVHCSCLA